MNLILQVDDDTAHAVDVGAEPSPDTFQEALKVLISTSRMHMAEKAAIAQGNAVAPPYPYPSHKDHAKGGEL